MLFPRRLKGGAGGGVFEGDFDIALETRPSFLQSSSSATIMDATRFTRRGVRRNTVIAMQRVWTWTACCDV
jgi:hypothetical protein